MSALAPEIHFVEVDGVRLRVLVEGPVSNARTPLVILHGFTGGASSMECVSEPLVGDRRIARIELVGHGESDVPEDQAAYSMEACAAQVVATIASLGFERPVLLGYSMGGRTALATAVLFPENVSGLILVGATAGIADPGLRAERVAADEALATRIEEDGLPAFVDAWMALPIFASQARLGEAALAQARAERLRNRPAGLARSLRGMGAGAQPPLFDRLSEFSGRSLLVVGEEDAKFREIAVRLHRGLPQAEIATLAAVGHAAHLEDPVAFATLSRSFLATFDEKEKGA